MKEVLKMDLFIIHHWQPHENILFSLKENFMGCITLCESNCKSHFMLLFAVGGIDLQLLFSLLIFELTMDF